MQQWAPSGLDFLIAFGLAQTTTFAQSIYLHRCLAHNAVDLHPAVRHVFRTVIWLLLGSNPREWVAAHRLHHSHADTAGDPHSPYHHGLWAVSLRSGQLVRRACRDRAQVDRLTRDITPDIFEKMPFGRRCGGILVSLALLSLLTDPMSALWIYVLALIQLVAGVSIVNGLGHLSPGAGADTADSADSSGRARHPIGRNLALFAPLTAGESLHANHHAAPACAVLATRRGEVDPGWWVISLMAHCGLASTPRTPTSDRSES
ncbi:fatty acid desaturase [Embleya sp. NBC_00896]|uniref:fatty acid desaturase n=1 Tax=Embleya sp. NBC_00896 TaxID=2975961 RepID=UPI003864F25C|nr:fatty acid desaturase [Embleya sp. NBC_00896]